jgi:hypothetical protein
MILMHIWPICHSDIDRRGNLMFTVAAVKSSSKEFLRVTALLRATHSKDF